MTSILTTAPLGQLATSPLRRFALVAAGIGLITLGAKTQVPSWPVPMTLQTLALMVLFATGGLRLSMEIILGYLALGLAGLPVFAGVIAGPLYLMGPTAGFLFGFVVAAVLIGAAADRGLTQKPLSLLASLLSANVAIFGLGFLWLGFLFTTSSGQTLGAEYAFSKGVQPFLLGGLVKIIIATVVTLGLGSWKKQGE